MFLPSLDLGSCCLRAPALMRQPAVEQSAAALQYGFFLLCPTSASETLNFEGKFTMDNNLQCWNRPSVRLPAIVFFFVSVPISNGGRRSWFRVLKGFFRPLDFVRERSLVFWTSAKLFQIGFSEVFSSCGFPQHRQQEQREQSLWNSGYLEIFWTSSKRMSFGSALKAENSLALDSDGLPFHRHY